MSEQQDEHRVVVSGGPNVVALYRALYAAKFAQEPEDALVPPSPLIAEIIEDAFLAFQAVMEQQIRADGQRTEDAKQRLLTEMRDSRRMQPKRSEWSVVAQRAAEAPKWSDWNTAERERYLSILSSPFVLEGNDRIRMLAEVEKVTAARG